MNYLVLDVGGSAVKCAILTEKAEILEQFSLDGHATSYSEWLERLQPHFKRCHQEYNLQGIAISTCGAVNTETGVIEGASALPYIHGFDVRSMYEEHFSLPTELENDACCAALAESWLGRGKDSNLFCLVVIGTGIGGAIVHHQQLQKGLHLHGGEFGYAIQEYIDGKPQKFGRIASTYGLVEQAARALDIDVAQIDGKQVFAMYDAGDPMIIDVVEEWFNKLAVGLYNIQYNIDPELILLGGGVSKRPDLVTQINKKLDTIFQLFPDSHIRPIIKVSQFGNDANLIGALKNFLDKRGV